MIKTRIDLIELLERWHKEKETRVDIYPRWLEDDQEIKTWWNPQDVLWTVDERSAFKGFVAREISADIDKLWES